MSDNLLTQLGVGGIFAVVIIREAFSFMKATKTKLNGDSPLTRKEFDDHSKSFQYKGECETTVAAIGQRFEDLDKLHTERKEHHDERFDRIDQHLTDVKEMVRNLK